MLREEIHEATAAAEDLDPPPSSVVPVLSSGGPPDVEVYIDGLLSELYENRTHQKLRDKEDIRPVLSQLVERGRNDGVAFTQAMIMERFYSLRHAGKRAKPGHRNPTLRASTKLP
jgi:hypothetical protein